MTKLKEVHIEEKNRLLESLISATYIDKSFSGRKVSKIELEEALTIQSSAICSCLEDIMILTNSIKEVATYPFLRRKQSDDRSPFIYAWVLSNTKLIEIYLSLFILVHSKEGQNVHFCQSYRKWLGQLRNLSFPNFDILFRYLGYSTSYWHKLYTKKVNLQDMSSTVQSFLIHTNNRRESLLRVELEKSPYVKFTRRRKGNKKKDLPQLNCQSALNTSINDANDDDTYDDFYDYCDGNGHCSGDEKLRERNDEGVLGDLKVAATKHDDTLSFQLDDKCTLGSLSDDEFSFVIEMEQADKYKDDICGNDWDKIPDTETVISVDTFSGDKLMFSYKDALLVNKTAPSIATKLTERSKNNHMAERTTKEVVLDTVNEDDLCNPYFDHDSAKLKGEQRQTLRALKGN